MGVVLSLQLMATALTACSSQGELSTAPQHESGQESEILSDASGEGAPSLAQCADVRGNDESLGQSDCGGGAGSYACQSGMQCKRIVKGQASALAREPDEVSCSTATHLCTAIFYGSGSQLFNPEESGFLFGAGCFGTCAGLAANRNVFAIPQCLTCFTIFARHWDVVADAQRAHYVLGMHMMSGRYIPHMGQGSSG
jgi:hypothetical protein